MKVIAVITTRWKSTRLPGKALLPINGKPMIQHIVDRARQSKVNDVIVATTTYSNPISDYCADHDIHYVRYPLEDDLIGRLYWVYIQNPCDLIIRIWGDCPLIDPENINNHIEIAMSMDWDYIFEYRDCKGKSVSAITPKLICRLWKELKTLKEQENFHTIILENPKTYNALILGTPYTDTTLNLSVDTIEDLKRVEEWLKLKM